MGEFHEKPKEKKMKWYSRDPSQKVKFYCNANLLISKTASWRESITFEFRDGPINARAHPPTCS